MSCCASTSSTTTPTARTDHCMNARPRAVPRHLPARSPDRSDVTGSAASYTSTSRSQDMTGFAAPTGWRTARSSGLSPSLRASLARLAGGQTSRQRSTRSGLLPLATSSQGCAGFSTAPRATPTRPARWPPCRAWRAGSPSRARPDTAAQATGPTTPPRRGTGAAQSWNSGRPVAEVDDCDACSEPVVGVWRCRVRNGGCGDGASRP